MVTIGIIGYGILGYAIAHSLKNTYEVKIIDPPKGLEEATLDDCDGYILCVPTPENDNGSCDTSLVSYYVERITKPLLVKSTVDPDVLCNLYSKYSFTYSPEFLREDSSIDDFKHQKFAIFSGKDPHKWHDIFINAGITMEQVKFTSVESAVYSKYVINTFLATKVTFFNEIYNHINNEETFNDMVSCVTMDTRIGKSHMQVPGPDGKFGYGGMCFPKDTKALAYSRNLQVLQCVIDVNHKLRG